jgi:hypothetical protein
MAAKSRPAGAHIATTPAAGTPTASTATDFRSIFTATQPSLANSGWATCPAPIMWSVDSHALSATEAADQISNLQWALSTWSSAAGLAFEFSGETAVRYDDAAFTIKPADGSAIATRHIYLAFVDDADSGRLDSDTVGLGGPTQVVSADKEITGGIAVFSTDYVAKATNRADRSLYLHELGHVLGLSHASESANIMYPMVTGVIQLGLGDVNGIKAMTKPCTEPAA